MPPAVPPAPDRLVAFLASPSDIASLSARAEAESRWEAITAPHALFLVLKDCVDMFHHGDADTQAWVRDKLGSATTAIEGWSMFAQHPDWIERLRQWEIASALVHAALSAVLMPPTNKSGAASHAKALRDAETELRKGKSLTVTDEWLEIARLSFHLERKTRSIRIPFAYVVDTAGHVGYLKFDLVDSESQPRLAHHPMHAYCSTISEEFNESVRRAWQSANGNWHGRWRLSSGARRGEDCIASAMGESASGAVAYGLGCLADNVDWDSGVIVLTTVDAGWRLQAVKSIAAKVDAVVNKAPQIHTIVVVEENREEAIAELIRHHQTFDLETQTGKRYQNHPNDLCCIRLHRGLKKRLRSLLAFSWPGQP
jgi:hypothetical protein